MRLVRLERQQSRVADDVRAALASLGRGSTVIGGIALVGVGSVTERPIEAVVLLPHGVIIVIGVDLPDPALRLEAPLGAEWKADGWPLVADDDAVNPATEALDISQACEQRIAELVPGTAPVGTIVAVGPYVETVDQPAGDLAGPVRVLHPTPTTMLAATVSLATAHRPRSVDQVRALIRGLAPEAPEFSDEILLGEGFSRFSDDSPPESLWDTAPPAPRQATPPAAPTSAGTASAGTTSAGAAAAGAASAGTAEWHTKTPVPAEPEPAEPGPAEPGPAGLAAPGSAELGPAEPRPPGLATPEPAKPTPAGPGPTELAEPAPAGPEPSGLGPAEHEPTEPGPAERAEPEPTESAAAKPEPARLGLAEPGPAAPESGVPGPARPEAEATAVAPEADRAGSPDALAETGQTETIPVPAPEKTSTLPIFPGAALPQSTQASDANASPTADTERTENLSVPTATRPVESEPEKAGSRPSEPEQPATQEHAQPAHGLSSTEAASPDSPRPFPTPRPPAPTETPASRTVRWLPLGAIGLLAALIVAAVVVATSGDDTAAAPGTTTPPAPPPRTTASAPPVQSLRFALRAADHDQRCASHAFGDAQASLQQTSCSGVRRASYAVTVDGRAGAVTVGIVEFPDAGQAAAFKAVADTPGGGGILDLATETGKWDGTPAPRFENAAYASKADGNSVRLVEAVWVPGPSTADDPGLARAAKAALDLPAE
ncbi:hypothetical protein GCM10027258_82560 [Amycolatopsis stemonae]